MTETLFPMPEESSQPAVRGKGQQRLKMANRHQVEMRLASLDELLAEDHVARMVWEMAQEYDLSGLYDAIDAVEGEAADRRLIRGYC